jgi:hypothetical protein
MTPVSESVRELAERRSNGTLTRLYWLQGTHQLWVEVYDPELDETIVIPAEPEHALEVFHHPYGFATADSGRQTGPRDRARPGSREQPGSRGVL